MLPLLVTAALIEHDGKVLLTRRKKEGAHPLLWEFPGGKLEASEDPKVCVVREIREELGIDIAIERLFEVVYYRYPERPVLIIAYCCSWISGEVVNLDVAEHRWVTPEELRNFDLLPADAPLADKLCAERAK